MIIIFLCDVCDIPSKQDIRRTCLLLLEAKTFTVLTPIIKTWEEPLKKLAHLGN